MEVDLEQKILQILETIGQKEAVIKGADHDQTQKTMSALAEVEKFYAPMGGIVGYHQKVLELLGGETKRILGEHQITQPQGLDLTEDTPAVRQAVLDGIEAVPCMAEMIPVGGAGERLQLVDPATGESLPVAALEFGGHTLLEGIIRDVEGREKLYADLFGQKVITPIALMTSHEKENHQKILALLEEHHWFGRPKESFFLFTQPMVPVIDAQGNWVLDTPGMLKMKPGGHGVIWKCAQDQGVLAWMQKQNRTHVLVRQINNPIGGLDHGLYALTGLAMQPGTALGFASCRRLVNTAEGVNVCLQRQTQQGIETGLTNIEYTEFSQYGIEDHPVESGSPYSVYPTNTNILVAKISEIQEAVKKLPFPGLLLNMKSSVETPQGDIPCGRLETMMQNIADAFSDVDEKPKKTFITLNRRLKTISVTKKAYQEGQPINETPMGAQMDQCRNAYDLLHNHCQFTLPEVESDEIPFTFIYHPALGPLYSVIKDKLRHGTLDRGAKLIVEMTEIDMENLHLGGTLILKENSLATGRAKIKDLHIPPGVTVNVTLAERSEVVINECVLETDLSLDIPTGHIAYVDKEGSRMEKIKQQQHTWSWNYSFESDHVICKKSA